MNETTLTDQLYFNECMLYLEKMFTFFIFVQPYKTLRQ